VRVLSGAGDGGVRELGARELVETPNRGIGLVGPVTIQHGTLYVNGMDLKQILSAAVPGPDNGDEKILGEMVVEFKWFEKL